MGFKPLIKFLLWTRCCTNINILGILVIYQTSASSWIVRRDPRILSGFCSRWIKVLSSFSSPCISKQNPWTFLHCPLGTDATMYPVNPWIINHSAIACERLSGLFSHRQKKLSGLWTKKKNPAALVVNAPPQAAGMHAHVRRKGTADAGARAGQRAAAGAQLCRRLQRWFCLRPCLHVFTAICTAFLWRKQAHKVRSSAQSAWEQQRTSSLLAPPCLSIVCSWAGTLHGSRAAQISILKSDSSHLAVFQKTAFSLVLKISWIPSPIASFKLVNKNRNARSECLGAAKEISKHVRSEHLKAFLGGRDVFALPHMCFDN